MNRSRSQLREKARAINARASHSDFAALAIGCPPPCWDALIKPLTLPLSFLLTVGATHPNWHHYSSCLLPVPLRGPPPTGFTKNSDADTRLERKVQKLHPLFCANEMFSASLSAIKCIRSLSLNSYPSQRAEVCDASVSAVKRRGRWVR